MQSSEGVPPTGVRERAKAETRERVREAARMLFQARGFADTTTQQVAAAARVSVGTLFQHADDKEDLLLLVLHGPLGDAMRASAAEPQTSDVLRDLTVVFGWLFEVYADLGRAARPAVRAVWFGSGANARAVQWLHETFLEQIITRIERAQRAGRLSDGAEARALANNLSAIYQAVLLDWLRDDEPASAGVTRLRAAFALQIIPLQTTPPGAPD
jgi:AcrR family transcriptional regulator